MCIRDRSVYLWAIGVAKAKNIYTEEQYQEALKEAADLVNHFQTVLDESEAWYDRNNASIVNSERIYVLGYGVDYGSMLEGVLKAGEMLRLPVLGYELEEYSHGPTMAIGPKQTILMIGSDAVSYTHLFGSDHRNPVVQRYADRDGQDNLHEPVW